MIDDDDFDVMGGQSNGDELASLLADVHAAKPFPTPPADNPLTRPSEPFAPKDRRAGSDRRETARSTRPPAPSEDARPPLDDLYGPAGTQPWEHLVYAFRVLNVGSRAKERAALLAMHVESSNDALDDAHSALGRRAHDAADNGQLTLPDEALGPIREALLSLEGIQQAQADVDQQVRKQTALASARRDAAAASLDPTEADQNARYAALDAAERRRDASKSAYETAAERLREVARTAPDSVREAGAELDRARDAAQLAEKTHRDAVLAYAESRRRAILQIGRVAEVDQMIDGLRAEERRAHRDAERRRDAILRDVRDAYVRLGVEVFDSGAGSESLSREYAVVRRIREERALTLALAATLRTRAEAIDPEALRSGRNAWLGVAAFLVVSLVLVAAFS